MNMELSRRQFLRAGGVGIAGTTLGALGFGEAESAHAASIRPYKLAMTKEARTICPYCAVCCGMVAFSAMNPQTKKLELTHIEGDSDNPVNRGTLCPKGAGAIDYVKSKVRVTQPMLRKAGANKFEPISWDAAMDKIAKAIKADRDANFVDTNKDGVKVNRLASTMWLAGSSITNESGWITWKATRGLGLLGVETQARI